MKTVPPYGSVPHVVCALLLATPLMSLGLQRL